MTPTLGAWTMVQQREEKHSIIVDGKLKETFERWSIDGGVTGVGVDSSNREALEDMLRAFKGKKPEKSLGSWTLYLIPGLLGFEFKPSVGWNIGGSGTASWTSRTLETYEYVPSKDSWGLKNTRDLQTPEPTFTGLIYGKISASFGINLVAVCVSPLHFKVEAAIKLNVSVPMDGNTDSCITIKLNFTGTVSIETGLWLSALGWEVQFVSAQSWKWTLWDITLLDLHYSRAQKLHRARKCSYSPMDYSFRFVTGTEWQPASMCYLKDGTYSVHYHTMEFLSSSVFSFGMWIFVSLFRQSLW